MKLESNAFQNGEPIPQKYTCDAENINPPLQITEVHSDAKSLALIMDDPDAPGGTWVHWVVWNIHPAVRDIPGGTVPTGGLEGRTSSNIHGYSGPRPPSGTHRYFFKLYALDTLLNIPLISGARDVEEAMKGHIIADAKVMGTYEKKK